MTAIDSLDAILEAGTETGAVVAIPGLLNWLAGESRPVDADFRASVDGGFTESFEDFCKRLSEKEAAS